VWGGRAALGRVAARGSGEDSTWANVSRHGARGCAESSPACRPGWIRPTSRPCWPDLPVEPAGRRIVRTSVGLGEPPVQNDGSSNSGAGLRRTEQARRIAPIREDPGVWLLSVRTDPIDTSVATLPPATGPRAQRSANSRRAERGPIWLTDSGLRASSEASMPAMRVLNETAAGCNIPHPEFARTGLTILAGRKSPDHVFSSRSRDCGSIEAPSIMTLVSASSDSPQSRDHGSIEAPA
jgi:hypothetical protein